MKYTINFVAIVLIFVSSAFGVHAAATPTSPSEKINWIPETNSGIVSDIAKVLGGIFSSMGGSTKSTSSLNDAISRDLTPTGIFTRLNEWFRGVTGIGIDQMFLAFWKLLLWFIRAIVGIIGFIAAKLLELLRSIF